MLGRFAVSLGESIVARRPSARLATYRDGTPLGYVGSELRVEAKLSDIDPKIHQLLVAVEDRRFHSHIGIDVRALARAGLRDLRQLALLEGGSTLTQQLLKNTVFRDFPRTPRKFAELLAAPIYDRGLGKARILEEYLNTVYMGGGTYGVRAAALSFLGREPDAVSWSEAALFAGLPAAPEAYAFWRPNDLARDRRDFVLKVGHRLGFLDREALRTSLNEQMPRHRNVLPSVRDFLAQLGSRTASSPTKTLVTTLDYDMQLRAARVARRAAVEDFCSLACVELGTGAVRAAVTCWPTADTGFDVALGGGLSPGSAVKPFVLAAALEAGFSISDRFLSGSRTLRTADGDWRVENFGGVGYGTVTLSEAILLSDNTVFAQLIEQVGHHRAAELMQRFGLPALPSPGPTLALGVLARPISPVELAASYSAFADGVPYAAPVFCEDGGRPVAGAVLDPAIARQVREVLGELVSRQIGGSAFLAGAFGKTGTPDDGRSGWFVGVRDRFAAVVVVGLGRRPRSKFAAQEVWARYMEEISALR